MSSPRRFLVSQFPTLLRHRRPISILDRWVGVARVKFAVECLVGVETPTNGFVRRGDNLPAPRFDFVSSAALHTILYAKTVTGPGTDGRPGCYERVVIGSRRRPINNNNTNSKSDNIIFKPF